jgi:type IV pilus assembly protein PilE
MNMRRWPGFTLIELMIVVVVISILVAVAYPSYQDYVRKGKRAEGKGALLKAAQVLERWYSDNNSYGNIPAPPAVATSIDLAVLNGLGAGVPIYSGENPVLNDPKFPPAYRITAAVGTCAAINACFQLTATPNAPFTDPLCGNLTLASNGVRCWSTAGTPLDTCAPTPANAANCKW